MSAEKVEKFVAWMQENKFLLHKAIKITHTGTEKGIAVHATAPIKKGALLFQIAPGMELSFANSSLASKLSAEDKDELEEGWDGLILALMYENSLPDSKWRPYLDLLPTQLNTPLFWSDEDLSYLKGTSLENRIGKEEIEKNYNEDIVPLLKKYPDVFKNSEFFTFEQFKRMGSIVMAYSFTDPDTGMVALMPMADMLNHSNAHNNARLFTPAEIQELALELEEEESMRRGPRRGARVQKKKPKPKEEGDPNAYKMKAIVNIKAGEEIFNTYGELGSGELLRKYGFVEEEENPYDTVDIDLKLVYETARRLCPDKELLEEKLAFIREHKVLEDEDEDEDEEDEKKESETKKDDAEENLSFLIEKQLLLAAMDRDEEEEEDEDMAYDDVDPVPPELKFVISLLWASRDEWNKWKEYFLKYEAETEEKLQKLRSLLEKGEGDDDEKAKIEEIPDEDAAKQEKPAEEKKDETETKKEETASAEKKSDAAPTFSFQPGQFNFKFDASQVQSAINNMLEQNKPATAFTFSGTTQSADLTESFKKGITKHKHSHKGHSHHHDDEESDEDDEYDDIDQENLMELMGLNDDEVQPPEVEDEDGMLNFLVEVFKDRLKLYPSTIEEDKANLPKAPNTNAKNALMVRIRERELLDDMIKWVTATEDEEDDGAKATGSKKGQQQQQQQPPECKQQ